MSTYILSQLKYDRQQLEPSDEARKKRKFRELVLSKKRESIATNARLAREEEQRVQARYKEHERARKQQRTLEDEQEVASTLVRLQHRDDTTSSREPSIEDIDLCIALGNRVIAIMQYAIAVSERRRIDEEFIAWNTRVWEFVEKDTKAIFEAIERLGIENIPNTEYKDVDFKELIQDLIRYRHRREPLT